MKEPEREKGTEVATAVAANAYVDAVEAGTARLLFSDAAGTWMGFGVPTAAITTAENVQVQEGAWLSIQVSVVDEGAEKPHNHLVEKGPGHARIRHYEAHGPRRVFELPATLIDEAIPVGAPIKIFAGPGATPRDAGELRKLLGKDDHGGDLRL